MESQSKKELINLIKKIKEEKQQLQKKQNNLEKQNKSLKRKIKDLNCNVNAISNKLHENDSTIFIPAKRRKLNENKNIPATPICFECKRHATKSPPGGQTCWSKTSKMQEFLILTEADFKDAKYRLSKYPEKYSIPTCLDELDNPQSKITSYLKIFRFFHDQGKVGERKKLPCCMVDVVRQKWPVEIDNDYSIEFSEDGDFDFE